MEQLQIVLSKADVVEDYEFSDKTTESHGTNSVLGGAHETEMTTANH